MNYYASVSEAKKFLLQNGWHEHQGGWVSIKMKEHMKSFPDKDYRDYILTQKEAVIYEAGLRQGRKEGKIELN